MGEGTPRRSGNDLSAVAATQHCHDYYPNDRGPLAHSGGAKRELAVVCWAALWHLHRCPLFVTDSPDVEGAAETGVPFPPPHPPTTEFAVFGDLAFADSYWPRCFARLHQHHHRHLRSLRCESGCYLS